jgi:cobalt-zinc-cadmium efflux system outer membrane protein
VSYLQENAAGTRDSFLMVQQELPTSGRLDLLRQAGDAAVRAEELHVKQAEYEVRQETRATFARLVAAQRRLVGLSTSLATLEELTLRLRERERAGDSSSFDRLRAERELADIKAQRRGAEADVAAARASLATLIGISGEAALVARDQGTLVPALPELTALLATARARRPDLQAADAQIARVELEERAASRLRYPQPIASAGLKRSSISGFSDTGFTFSIGVVLPIFQHGQADVAVANAALLSARAERDALTIALEQEVRAAHVRASTLRAVADDYQREAFDRSRELVRIATIAYDDGELGILELLDAHRSLLSAELRAIELSTDARLAAIALERVTGEEMKR